MWSAPQPDIQKVLRPLRQTARSRARKYAVRMAFAEYSRGTKTGLVIEELRKRIADGAYPAGRKLPTAGELATEFGVAVGTVRAALGVLDKEGLTVSRQGKPRIVAGGNAEHATKYEQLAEQLRLRIKAGTYAAGSGLPGELALAAEYGVSRATVKAALTSLESTGALVTRPGRRRVVAGADRTSDARYEQVAGAIMDEIRDGHLRAGSRLPSEQKLAEMYGVSRVTVRQALSVLRDRGLVEAVPRSGTFVRAQG